MHIKQKWLYQQYNICVQQALKFCLKVIHWGYNRDTTKTEKTPPKLIEVVARRTSHFTSIAMPRLGHLNMQKCILNGMSCLSNLAVSEVINLKKKNQFLLIQQFSLRKCTRNA